MKDYYQILKDALSQKWPKGSGPLNKLEQLKKNGDELGIIKMYNQYKSIVKDYRPPTRFDESKKMTKESFKEYIRNEIIEMLSPDDAEKAAGDIEKALGESEDTIQGPTTITIPEEMHYADFAKAVAEVLINEYGQHNFEPFMEILHKELGM